MAQGPERSDCRAAQGTEMIRWLAYLLALLVMQVVAWIITPLLPLFAVIRYGKLANGNSEGLGVRLPVWLSWFDTPDNALSGDSQWFYEHGAPTHWSMVAWLYRNSLYGFKWGPLAAPMQAEQRIIDGDTTINRNNGHFGVLRIKMGDYWQFKMVKPLFAGYCVMLNFGWLLDDASQTKALFMFSPRVCKAK